MFKKEELFDKIKKDCPTSKVDREGKYCGYAFTRLGSRFKHVSECTIDNCAPFHFAINIHLNRPNQDVAASTGGN